MSTNKLDEDHRVKLLLKPERSKLVASMVRAMMEASHLHGLFRSCLNCAHFNETEGELCQLAVPPSRPPARVIVTGCVQHTDNYSETNIPF